MPVSKRERTPEAAAVKRDGAPLFVPTETERKLAEELAGLGLPYRQIATLIREGIGVALLQAAFSKELERGKANASAKVARTLYGKAMAGDTTSLIWWTKAQLRWSETTKSEVSGPNGGEIPITEIRRVIVDPLKRPENVN